MDRVSRASCLGLRLAGLYHSSVHFVIGAATYLYFAHTFIYLPSDQQISVPVLILAFVLVPSSRIPFIIITPLATLVSVSASTVNPTTNITTS